MSRGTMNRHVDKAASSAMSPLEIDEEMSYLFEDTLGRGNLRKRIAVYLPSSKKKKMVLFGAFRSRFAFFLRNILILSFLGLIVVVSLNIIERKIEKIPLDQEELREMHQLGFGGDHNPSSYEGIAAHHMNDEENLHHVDLIPNFNMGEKVESLAIENIINHIGHYWHDPSHSVFSSPFYDNVTPEELELRQSKFLRKLNETKKKFGSWEFVDPFITKNGRKRKRPLQNFAHVPYKDLNCTEFLKDTWQSDERYVLSFINEALKLVKRVREGIYEEYGHSSLIFDSQRKMEQEVSSTDKIFQVILTEDDNTIERKEEAEAHGRSSLSGIAHFSRFAWDGLIRKLLHSMITNDQFYVVAVGDGSAAGHGNNFLQSPIMQFQYLMEPVFKLLGVTLVSRNMAMRNASVVFSALAGSDILGEMDLLWFDSSSKIDTKGAKDLLYKQSILSGERVPVILTDDPVNIWNESSQSAWIGKLLPNDAICSTQDTGICDMKSHNSICWVPRKPFKPEEQQDHEIPPESFPGNNAHLLESRKLSILMLSALEDSLNRWSQGIEDHGFPLSNSFWHVGADYDTIRKKVQKSHEGQKSECETMMKNLDVICHFAMHGYTEWTPRMIPNSNSLRSITSSEPALKNFYGEAELYEDTDLMPPQWEIPLNQTDPHLIAISTNDIQNFDDDDDVLLSIPADDDTFRSEDNGDRQAREESFRLRYLLNYPVMYRAKEPERGWTVQAAVGFCDGSAQSRCGRTHQSKCLMAGHNDYTGGISGDETSGWLLFRVRSVKQGIILASIETTIVDNGDSNHRLSERNMYDRSNSLYNTPISSLPSGFWLDISVNGTMKSLNHENITSFTVNVEGGVTLYPIYLSSSLGGEDKPVYTGGETINLGIRIRSEPDQILSLIMTLTHIYYA